MRPRRDGYGLADPRAAAAPGRELCPAAMVEPSPLPTSYGAEHLFVRAELRPLGGERFALRSSESRDCRSVRERAGDDREVLVTEASTRELAPLLCQRGEHPEPF